MGQREDVSELRASQQELRSALSQRPIIVQRPTQRYIRITQASHGLASGDVIRHSGTAWVKSQADTPANAHVQAMVIRSLNSGAFLAALPGSYITGLSVTKGQNWTSSATAGLITATAPIHMRPCFYADTTTSGILLPDGPVFTVDTNDPGTTAATDGDLWFKY